MVEINESCRMLEKDRYWKEFNSNRHSFFKIMIGDFRNRLRIPRKFMANFKGTLLDTIRLRGPSEFIWNVKLARTVDDVLFQNGWEKFVSDHSLTEADFLVFHYDKNSTFNVTIYDMSGCEREGSYFVKKHTSACLSYSCPLQRLDREDTTKNIRLGEIQEEIMQKGKLKSEKGNRTSRVVGTNYKHQQLKGTKERGTEGAKSDGSRQIVRLELIDEPEEDTLNMLDDSEDWKCASRKTLTWVDEYESEMSSDAEFLPSKADRKKKTSMQSTNQIVVSKKFKRSEEKDSINSMEASEHQQSNHGKGKHRRESDAKDIIFQPSEPHPLESSGKSGRSDAQMSKSVLFENTTEEKKGLFLPLGKPKMETGDLVKLPDRGRFYRLYFISNRRRVTEKEKADAYRLSTLHTSTRPSFRRVLKPTSVYKFLILNIPKEWASKHFPCNDMEIRLGVRPGKKDWAVRFQKTQWSCTLTRGWLDFVWDNNLEEDDVCVFELQANKKTDIILDVNIFRVVDEVVRLTRLF